MAVIFGSDGVMDGKKIALICGAISESICHVETSTAPPASESLAPGDRRVIDFKICGRRIHHEEHDRWKLGVPTASQDIAILLFVPAEEG